MSIEYFNGDWVGIWNATQCRAKKKIRIVDDKNENLMSRPNKDGGMIWTALWS